MKVREGKEHRKKSKSQHTSLVFRFSSIKRCKRSVSISCSFNDEAVDGAPILLFNRVGSMRFVAGGGIDISGLFG